MSSTEPLTRSQAGNVTHVTTGLVDQGESACQHGHQCTINDTPLPAAGCSGQTCPHAAPVWHRAAWSKVTHCASTNCLSRAFHSTSLLSYKTQTHSFTHSFTSSSWQSRETKPSSHHILNHCLVAFKGKVFTCSKKCCPNEC